MSLILRHPLAQQPQQAVELSAFARQIGTGAVLLPLTEALTGHGPFITKTGGSGVPTLGVGIHGLRREWSLSSDFFLDEREQTYPHGAYWWCLYGYFSAVGTWSGLVCRTMDNAIEQGWAWQRRSSTNTLTVYHANSSVDIGTINDLLDTTPRVWVGVWDETTASLYRDGVLVRSGGITTIPGRLSGSGQIKLASSRDISQTSGAAYMAAFGQRNLLPSAVRSISANPWQLFAPQERRIWVPAGGGGGAVTAIASLSAAVQAARSISSGADVSVQSSLASSASLGAAVSLARSAQSELTAAVQAALTGSTSADAAVQAAGSAVASLQTAVQIVRSIGTGADAVVQQARTAAASLDAAVQQARIVAASLDAFVQAGFTLSASADAAVQTGAVSTANLSAAVQSAITAAASASAAVQAGTARPASMDTAVQHQRVQQASLDAFIQAGSQLVAFLSAAVQASVAASASIDTAVVLARSASSSLSAAIAVRNMISSAMAAAVQANIAASASLNAFVLSDDPDELYPLAGLTQAFPLAGQSQTYPLQ